MGGGGLSIVDIRTEQTSVLGKWLSGMLSRGSTDGLIGAKERVVYIAVKSARQEKLWEGWNIRGGWSGWGLAC